VIAEPKTAQHRTGNMKYRLLGKSGLRVSEFALGTLTFGDDWGWGAPKDEAQEVYNAFRESGGNFIATANIYTNGTSETFLGEFMKGHQRRPDTRRLLVPAFPTMPSYRPAFAFCG
jgi:predicted aldo/keto reductase-like oxidoreductase